MVMYKRKESKKKPTGFNIIYYKLKNQQRTQYLYAEHIYHL